MSSSSSYALPTAPPVESIYPNLTADNFRLNEISRIEKEISDQVEHYRLVLKKYKKARKPVHYSAVGLGSLSAVLSSGAIAASLTGVGVIVGAPVAVSNKEFELVTREMEKYRQLKETLRSKFVKKPRLLLHSLTLKKSVNRFGKSLQKNLSIPPEF